MGVKKVLALSKNNLPRDYDQRCINSYKSRSVKMLKIFRGGELVPLWIEHTTDNEDEMLRLSHLGCKLTGEEGQATAVLGQLKYTRLETLPSCYRTLGKINYCEVVFLYIQHSSSSV